MKIHYPSKGRRLIGHTKLDLIIILLKNIWNVLKNYETGNGIVILISTVDHKKAFKALAKKL